MSPSQGVVGRNVMFVKGAPENVLARCTSVCSEVGVCDDSHAERNAAAADAGAAPALQRADSRHVGEGAALSGGGGEAGPGRVQRLRRSEAFFAQVSVVGRGDGKEAAGPEQFRGAGERPHAVRRVRHQGPCARGGAWEHSEVSRGGHSRVHDHR